MRPIFNPDGYVLHTSTRLISEKEATKYLGKDDSIQKFLKLQRDDIIDRFKREAERLSDRANAIENRDVRFAITEAKNAKDDTILSLWYKFTYVLNREGYTADLIIENNF